jgi:hypothetical protein
MGTTLRKRFKQESGFGKGDSEGLRDLNLQRLPLYRLATAADTNTSLPSPIEPKPEHSSHSSRTSSEQVSDIAPEIIVWTDDMDIDDQSQDEPLSDPAESNNE